MSEFQKGDEITQIKCTINSVNSVFELRRRFVLGESYSVKLSNRRIDVIPVARTNDGKYPEEIALDDLYASRNEAIDVIVAQLLEMKESD